MKRFICSAMTLLFLFSIAVTFSAQIYYFNTLTPKSMK